MRAWEIGGAFGLANLRPVERPVPEPGPGELLLRVRAVALNYRDLLMVEGVYDPRQALPLVPCSDAVGEVAAIGPGVRGFSEGDRVLPVFVQGWLAGGLERAQARTTLGGPLDGSLREWMTVPAEAVVRAPAHLSDEEAATLPCAGVTAWRTLVVEGRVKPGDTVLTLGTGGVSLFAVQLGAMLGARVVVTSSRRDKLERALALGAVHGVSYVEDPAWGRTVSAWTGGQGVDLVVEVGGAGTLEQSLRAVRTGGTIALIGVLAGSAGDVALTRIFMHGVRVQGVYVGSRADLQALVRALEAHPQVRPVVDRVFDFDEVPAAFDHLKQARHFGKIAVRVA